MTLHPLALAAIRAARIAETLRAHNWQLSCLTPADRQFCRAYRRMIACAS